MEGTIKTLWSYKEAAHELGVTYPVLRWLVEQNGITPKPVPYSGVAKGLDREDMATLRRAVRGAAVAAVV